MKFSIQFLVAFLLVGNAVGQTATLPDTLSGQVMFDLRGRMYKDSEWKKLVRAGVFKIAGSWPDSLPVLVGHQTRDRLTPPYVYRKPPLGRFFTTGQSFGKFNYIAKDGKRYSSADLLGKIVVLNFWFVNCHPCRREIPELNKLAAEFPDSNVVFLAITHDSKAAVERYVEQNPFIYDIIPATRDNRIQAFPVNVVLDKQGNVAYHSNGYHVGSVPWLRYTISSLLGY